MADTLRWKAEITYRRETREYPSETHVFLVEEIADLHDVLESGPNFYAVEKIVITLNDTTLATTIEAAERE